MGYNPQKPIDEQDSRLWRYAPWVFIVAVLVIAALIVL